MNLIKYFAQPEDTSGQFLGSLRLVMHHTAITLLAVWIAFRLPEAASYILFVWWPKVQDNSEALLITEIALAAFLVFLFHMIRFAWICWRKAKLNEIASLVHARDITDGWLARLADQSLREALPWNRDLFVMDVTGREIFDAEPSGLRNVLKDCHELRVMLLNPNSRGARMRANSLGEPDKVLARFRREVADSIKYLAQLRESGRKVSLKLYEERPLWKLVFAGDRVWVQYCHDGRDTRDCPEYAFALQPRRPERGFFPALFSYFLNRWDDPANPEYSFESSELIYRGGEGMENERIPFPSPELALEAQAGPPREADARADSDGATRRRTQPVPAAAHDDPPGALTA